MDVSADVPAVTRQRVLRDGLAAWRAQGLITPEQHDRLLASVVAPAGARRVGNERKLGRGVTILVNVGAIVLAAGLIIFFASNWVDFGRAAKIGSLVALTLFFYVAVGIGWESAVVLNTNIYTRLYEYFWEAMPKPLFFIARVAARDGAQGRLYVREAQSIVILDTAGTLLERVDSFRLPTEQRIRS
jgi:hypothetical protein